MNTIYFLLAVSATSAAIFALTTRADRINRRAASSDGSPSDSWTASWFGSNHFGPSTDM